MIPLPNHVSVITRRWIPHKPTICDITTCVYNSGYSNNTEWICDDPYCNKGNSDASCHKISPRNLLPLLTRIEK